jgi:hypothetical protein
MHDFIHAAIATDRVRDLVEDGETRRARRRVKRERAQADARDVRPLPQPSGPGGRVAAKLRLRPRAM